ncbi:uncharacterized protein PAC_06246 [Phialocephala subalpina]|uniref:Uncharacterized protein n=1 Tax=Phialocephala subalpina TaxID=576137 RepID=A0A1L7WUC4_9HELO|nr:uncharacterized protein PAC_06246 [Phialocephala subalpina]
MAEQLQDNETSALESSVPTSTPMDTAVPSEPLATAPQSSISLELPPVAAFPTPTTPLEPLTLTQPKSTSIPYPSASAFYASRQGPEPEPEPELEQSPAFQTQRWDSFAGNNLDRRAIDREEQSYLDYTQDQWPWARLPPELPRVEQQAEDYTRDITLEARIKTIINALMVVVESTLEARNYHGFRLRILWDWMHRHYGEPFQLFAATAAYSAILMVFLQLNNASTPATPLTG